ncbi:MAG: DUF6473 family protein [Pseudomonadota bacterium]
MAFVHPGDGALDYYPCRYGMSKLLFRGPHRAPAGGYCVSLGGTETYGKFIAMPYPALLERRLSLPVINLGCINAGPDVYLNDPGVLDLAAGARVAVVQVVGAQNLTNRYYTVHPRRNDRFLSASPLLRHMFRDVDFTEFHFTRHMLQTLQAVGPDRFEILAEELRAAWVQRMKALLARLPRARVLVWLAGHAPLRAGLVPDLHQDPILVDAEMIAALMPHVSAYAEHITSGPHDTRGMVFAPMEEPAAQGLPGPAVHQDLAETLAPMLDRFL